MEGDHSSNLVEDTPSTSDLMRTSVSLLDQINRFAIRFAFFLEMIVHGDSEDPVIVAHVPERFLQF